MNIPCPSPSINCPGSDFPILNISSEGVDQLLFAATIPFNPQPPNCLSCSPIGIFHAVDCHGVVFSATSQLEADLLALAASVNCNPPPAGTCYNEEQTASYTCPDGIVFSYTSGAGTFSSPNFGDEAACVVSANAQALAFAQQQLSQQATNCPEIPPPLTCVISSTSPLPDGDSGSAYSHTMVGTTNFGNDQWALASGTLPPGLSLTPAGVIQGTPTTPGTYNFTLQLQGS